jgi:hypothetical protein
MPIARLALAIYSGIYSGFTLLSVKGSMLATSVKANQGAGRQTHYVKISIQTA